MGNKVCVVVVVTVDLKDHRLKALVLLCRYDATVSCTDLYIATVPKKRKSSTTSPISTITN